MEISVENHKLSYPVYFVPGMESSRTVLDLEDTSRTKIRGLGLGLDALWPWPWPRTCRT